MPTVCALEREPARRHEISIDAEQKTARAVANRQAEELGSQQLASGWAKMEAGATLATAELVDAMRLAGNQTE